MRLLLIIIILFTTVIISTLTLSDQARVLLLFVPYKIEMSARLAFLALVVSFVVFYLLVRIFVGLSEIPKRISQIKSKARTKKLNRYLTSSLSYWIQNRRDLAREEMERARGLKPLPFVLKAWHAYLMLEDGKENITDRLYADLRTDLPSEKQVARALLVKSFLHTEEYHKVVEALSDGESLKKKSTSDLRSLLTANEGLKNANAVLDIADILHRRGVLNDSELEIRRYDVLEKKLREETDGSQGVREVVRKLSNGDKMQKKIVLMIVRHCIRSKDFSLAREMAERFLDKNWDTDVLCLYAMCLRGKESEALVKAENWIKSHPDDATLLAILGELCIANEIWGKANSYLRKSLKLRESVRAYWQMAQLYEKTGKSEESNSFYLRGLRLAIQLLNPLTTGVQE